MADTQITSIDQVKRDMFVKLVDRDKQGKFSYIGQVTDINLGHEQKVGMEKKKVRVGAGFTMKAMVEIGSQSMHVLILCTCYVIQSLKQLEVLFCYKSVYLNIVNMLKCN